MSVIVVGLHQHQAALDVLERAAVPEEALGKTLTALRERANLSEVVILSTCLRTEIYAVVERFHEGVTGLQEFLAARVGTSVDVLADDLMVQFDDAVTVHLFEVAAGMRSAVLGESEVLGQVRRAIDRAEAERVAGPVLGGLFRRAVQTGRKVRTSTAIARGSTSLSHVAVELATQRLGGSLAQRRVVVVGAGEMGDGIISALDGRGADVTVVNRTARRAQELAGRVGGIGYGLSELRRALQGAEALLVSIASPTPVVDADTLGRAGLTGSRLVVVDLGMPRNVAPAVGSSDGVELLDMDDLRAHAELAMAGRQAEIEGAQEIVRQEVDRYRTEVRARGAAPIVSALRGRLDDVRAGELERLRARRPELGPGQWEAVDAVTRDVLAKVLHQPTMALKEAAGTPRGERLVEALRTLFDL